MKEEDTIPVWRTLENGKRIKWDMPREYLEDHKCAIIFMFESEAFVLRTSESERKRFKFPKQTLESLR